MAMNPTRRDAGSKHATATASTPSSVSSSFSRKKFQPYKDQTIECVLAHLVLEPFFLLGGVPILQPVLQIVYRVRFWLAQPLNTHVLPKWTPRMPVPLLKFLSYVTVGEVLLTLPLIILLLAGYNLTFESPSLDAGGTVAGYAILLTYLTASKSNSLIAFVLGIPFERMIGMHLLCSLVSIVLGIFHTYVAYSYGGDDSGDSGDSRDGRRLSGDSVHWKNGLDPDVGMFLLDGGTNTSGTLILICMVGLVATSFFSILRRYCFNMWLLSHVALAIGVIVFCVAHSVSSIWFMAVWWMVDWVVRYAILAGCRYPTTCTLRRLRNDVVTITFPKPPSFTYRPGQFVQVAFPALSVLEFHPISLSSAPHEPTVTMHIRALGNWSRRVLELSSSSEDTTQETSTMTTRMLMEGPYGNVSVDMDNAKRYQTALLISGGIGVTHCQSVGKSLLYDHVHRNRALRNLRFVWVVRDWSMVEDMPVLAGAEDRAASSSSLSGVQVATGGEDMELAHSTCCSVQSSSCTTSDENSTSPRDVALETIELAMIHDEKVASWRDIVQTDIYQTTSKKPNSSPSTALPSNHNHHNTTVHQGRPNVNVILEEIKQESLGHDETHVMVFACGPRGLLEQVQEACRQHSKGFCREGIVFDLHLETFEF